MNASSPCGAWSWGLLAWAWWSVAGAQNFTFEGGGAVGGGGAVQGERFAALWILGEGWVGQASNERHRTEVGIGIVEPRLDPGSGPKLTVERTGNRLTLAWDTEGVGFALQEASDAARGPWMGVGVAPERVDGRWRVEVPISGTRYYRLVALPPWLRAEVAATSVRLTWDSFDPSFVVQESRSGFEEADWIDRATSVRPIDGRWLVELPVDSDSGTAFFRLRRRGGF